MIGSNQMSKILKLSHHIKKIEPPVTIATSIDFLSNELIRLHSEYKLEDASKFRKVVDEALKSVLSSREEVTAPSSSSVKLMSMNQVLMNQYQNAPSKRHKPETTEQKSNVQDGVTSATTGEDPPSNKDEKTDENETTSTSNTKKKTAKRKLRAVDGADLDAETISGLGMGKAPALNTFLSPQPLLRLKDLAGIESILSQVRELVFYPVQYPDLYQMLGVQPPCGLLLRGPSGCGKTSLACAIAGELGLPFFKASGPELIGGASGESESRIRDLFAAATAAAPSILFLDNIDVIAAKYEAGQSRGMDRRIIAQLLDCVDAVSLLGQGPAQGQRAEGDDPSPPTADTKTGNIPSDINARNASNQPISPPAGPVILLAGTNKPDSLDSCVRGRFSRELSLPVPDAPSRTKILTLMAAALKCHDDVDMAELGRQTPGFVGSDLKALVREAGMLAVSRILSARAAKDDLKNEIAENGDTAMLLETVVISDEQGDTDALSDPALYVEMADFLRAAKTVTPSAKREGFAVVPDVTWSDVGALAEVREELLHNVLEPIAHPERFRSLGLEVPAGVLFFGPPGCGKTLLAKAVANQSGANFISVKGPELLNMFVGESESRVRQVFSRARQSAPCVIFFDELDALCPRRGSGDGGGNGVSERVVNQLLTELDGLESRKDVYIIAATNRLELIDDAMLRPGRLGKLLYVPLPSADDRVAILQALTRTTSIDHSPPPTGVDLVAVGRDPRTEGFSGADCSALVREAGLAVIREWREMQVSIALQNHAVESDSEKHGTPALVSSTNASGLWDNPSIAARHFESAFLRVKPSVASSDRDRYEKVHRLMKEGMGAIQALNVAGRKG